MTMETVTMKATVFAKKLRTRLAHLRKQREMLLKTYDADVHRWRQAMTAWLLASGPNKVRGITKEELQGNRGRYSRAIPFDLETFFAGMPQAPKFPSDQQIRAVQSALRHLDITGQSTIKVSEVDTRKLFGDPEEDD